MKITTRRSSQKGAFAAIEATEYTAELSYYEDNTLAASHWLWSKSGTPSRENARAGLQNAE